MAQPKRDAQNALFAAIQNQAENNMKSALRATEKAALLRELAEAYRLTAGGALPDVPARRPRQAEEEDSSSQQSQSRDDSSDQDRSADEEETQQEERPRRRTARRRLAG